MARRLLFVAVMLRQFCVAVLLLVPLTVAAAPVSGGIEAEISGHHIDLSAVTKLRAWGTPTYADTGAEISQRLVCTTAQSPLVEGYPLLSITYDMWSQTYVGGHVRRLELVSGPVEAASDSEWAKVLAAIETYFRLYAVQCGAPVEYDVVVKKAASKRRHCSVSVQQFVDASGGAFTTRCHADPRLDLTAAAASEIRLLGHLDGQDRVDLKYAIENASVQLSLGIDLESFATLDLDSLFDGTGGPMRAYPRLRKAGRLTALAKEGFTAEQQGFVALSYASFHPFLFYMLKKFDSVDDLAGTVSAYALTDEHDYKLKNEFPALPKASLGELHQRLAKRDGAFADRYQKLAARWFCSDENLFIRRLQVDPDDDLEEACEPLYDRVWKPALTEGRDPLWLKEIANPIDAYEVGGKLRVVVELRGGNTGEPRKSRGLVVRDPDPKKLTIDWQAKLQLPGGL